MTDLCALGLFFGVVALVLAGLAFGFWIQWLECNVRCMNCLEEFADFEVFGPNNANKCPHCGSRKLERFSR